MDQFLYFNTGAYFLYYDPCALAILIREYVPFDNCQVETGIRNRGAYEWEGHGKSERHFVLRGMRGW